MITIHPFDDELDDAAVDFLFEEVSEPEEMTDDDSNVGRIFFQSRLFFMHCPRQRWDSESDSGSVNDNSALLAIAIVSDKLGR